MKEKIVQLLKHGLSPSVVAKATGVDISYVSQLMADEGIRAEVAEARMGDVERNVQVDRRIEVLEEKALQKLDDLIPFTSKPGELLRIFEVMNSAKKKTAEVTALQSDTKAPLVELHIHQAAAVALRLSSDNQVVEVDGRSMATLPAKVLTEKLKERREARPLLSDQQSAQQILNTIEEGIPADSLVHVL